MSSNILILRNSESPSRVFLFLRIPATTWGLEKHTFHRPGLILIELTMWSEDPGLTCSTHRLRKSESSLSSADTPISLTSTICYLLSLSRISDVVTWPLYSSHPLIETKPTVKDATLIPMELQVRLRFSICVWFSSINCPCSENVLKWTWTVTLIGWNSAYSRVWESFMLPISLVITE